MALHAFGCRSSGPSEPRPVAALASTRAAQDSFRPIRHAFVVGNRAERASLEPLLERFLATFPRDGLVPLAELYLAIIAVDQGNLEQAERLIVQVEAAGGGTTHDLAELVYGSIWLARKDPTQALERFLPLVGKLIDPYARILLDEQVVAATIATRAWYEAIAYMDLWLRDAQEDELLAVQSRVTSALEAFPSEVLERMLKTMQGEREGAGYGTEIRKALITRLSVVAIEKQDTNLARRLVESTGTGPSLGDAAEGLEELASSGGAPVADGRTLGLLMSTGALETQAGDAVRAADVLTGVMDALRSETHGAPPDGARLLTRDERDPKRTELTLRALANQGASILIAGVGPEQAASAASFSERTRVPLLLLWPLAPARPLPPTVFVLGAATDKVAALLASALATRGARVIAPVGGKVDAEIAGRFAWGPAAGCDVPTVQAGEPRFPVDAWRKGRVDAFLLLGDAPCAFDALADIAVEGLGPTWAGVGLEAGQLAVEARQFPLLVARAGAFPLLKTETSSPLIAFQRRQGKAPSWFSVLGHDAAVLARAALAAVPPDRAEESGEVARRHQLVATALARVETELWSTEERGLAGGNTIPRDIKITEVR